MRHIIKDFSIIPGEHCLCSTLHNILRYYNYSISEEEIYFLSDELNIGYKKGNNFKWKVSCESLINNITSSLSIKTYSSFNITNKEALVDELCKLLEKDKFIVLWMDSSFLAFNSIYTENEGHEHIILMYGIDTDSKTAYVGDSFLLDYSGKVLTYSGPVALEHILNGMWGYICLDIDEQTELPEKGVILDKIWSNLKRHVAEDRTADAYKYGIHAYREFFLDFDSIMFLPDDVFVSKILEIYYSLRIGSVMHLITYLEKFTLENNNIIPQNIYDEIKNDIHPKLKKNLLNIYKTGISKRKNNLELSVQNSFILIDKIEKIIKEILNV